MIYPRPHKTSFIMISICLILIGQLYLALQCILISLVTLYNYDCNLSQLVTAPTHCKGNCLDLILTNSPESVSPISISFHHLIRSDHYMLSFTLSAKSHPKQPTKYAPDLPKLDYNQYTFVKLTLVSVSINWCWRHCLRGFIHNAIAPLCAYRKIKPHARIAFQNGTYNSEIRHQINIVRSLRKKAKSLHTATSLLLKLEAAEQCQGNYMNLN